ncbi:sulfur carrier protein ThiS [Azospirillum sp. TSO22-1]|uniref:sulfur carrier protein ThiS n=1 Tax=Azospirillum sp. TSO22-1 TaxID=716789 RepID=UPI000D605013|nr:sulfur carrier protein ThiS [Azospirillum sp. TSO22-1]PWC54327.1 thiamine biosynthesis protein ThiS [Azospirillum sp. TSO22-1]
MTTIRVNGTAEPLEAASVADLLAARGIGPDTPAVAVALNGAVVRRAQWAETPLNPGDDLDIVRPFQGG